ncbi:hypothetical protein DPMN_116388 [Dreissena polymorpha]|uniref:BED-type domain-containing protein n=1 Tax=Dreissena polymorpha TaxID=45954 RepID=A0A9D4KNV6_DREPO|nr:hypothetical protein DPMN_116388 [Dreissena polymorpha]
MLSITSAGKMASSTTLKDAPSKLTSNVWNHFGFSEGSDAKATCKTCCVDVSYPKSGSTTDLRQHLKRKHSVDISDVICITYI